MWSLTKRFRSRWASTEGCPSWWRAGPAAVGSLSPSVYCWWTPGDSILGGSLTSATQIIPSIKTMKFHAIGTAFRKRFSVVLRFYWDHFPWNVFVVLLMTPYKVLQLPICEYPPRTKSTSICWEHVEHVEAPRPVGLGLVLLHSVLTSYKKYQYLLRACRTRRSATTCRAGSRTVTHCTHLVQEVPVSVESM